MGAGRADGWQRLVQARDDVIGKVQEHSLDRMIGQGRERVFGIGGVGLVQFASGRIHTAWTGGQPEAPYVAIFAFIAMVLAAGLLFYVWSRDTQD